VREDEERRMRIERQKLALQEEMSRIKVLFQERVHDSNARWSDVSKTLKNDPRYQTKLLAPSDVEKLFEDHLKTIENVRRGRLGVTFWV